MYDQEKLFIGGEWVAPDTSEKITAIDPATEEISGTAPAGSPADIDRAVLKARDAFDNGPWPRMSPSERADILQNASKNLLEQSDDMAHRLTAEMGSPIAQSIGAQIPVGIDILDYYTKLARQFEWEETRPTYDVVNQPLEIRVRKEPVGVVAAIIPWNGPQIVGMMKLAPALVAGCTAILKPAPEACLNLEPFAQAFMDAGLPPGVLNIVPAHRDVGEYLVNRDGVDKVSFTGSTAAGRRIASLCGERIRRLTLELGGKSAAVLLEDVDLDKALPDLVGPMMFISGQACNAQTRILAPRSRYDEIVEAAVAVVEAVPYGDPRDPRTFVGPLAAERQRDRVESYIEIGKSEGARVVLGGNRPKEFPKGWYVEKTIFSDVESSMRIAQEEIFGPVYVIIPYDDVPDAIRIANDSTYGLAGSVWTGDQDYGYEVASQIRSGSMGVNAYNLDCAAPFGGYRDSGIGRERGIEGLLPFIETKAILIPKRVTK